jgi:ATP synthase protein I
VVAFQFLVAGIVGFLFFVFAGSRAGVSALAGGAINAVATYYQVRIAFSPRFFGDPRQMARAFYAAEVVKIAIIVALFSLALKWLDPAGGPMLTAFAATMCVYFMALLWSPLSDN